MTRRAALPDGWGQAPFSVSGALEAGVSASRLRASDLVAPFHGVRTPVSLLDRVEWLCRAYQERMRAGDVFSHSTVARLYGLPLPLYLAAEESHASASPHVLHVSTKAPGRAPEGRGVLGHRVPGDVWKTREVVYRDPETGEFLAFAAMTPEVAWAQLATALDLGDLVALGDAMVAHIESSGSLIASERPFATIADLSAAVMAWGSRPGSQKLRAALALVRVGSLSRPESLCRVQLMAAGIPEPQLNVHVADAAGRPIARADISWPQFRVLVEYEGDWHRTSLSKFRSDITRGELYVDGEWRGMRATADDVFGDPNPFIGRVARALERCGWQRPSRGLRQSVGARP